MGRERWIPAQRSSNAENISIWWRHHDIITMKTCLWPLCQRGHVSIVIMLVEFVTLCEVMNCNKDFAIMMMKSQDSAFELSDFTLVGFLREYDDVIKWKHFPRYWPSVWGIHRSPVNSPHKGQWRGALGFSLICALNKRLSKQLGLR